MNRSASVKAKLRNISEQEKRSYQELLQTYALERVVCRLSLSSHVDKFALKGGIFLYALFDGKFSRATTDIDLLGENISNEKVRLKTVFEEILTMEMDDGILFDSSSIQVNDIAEFKAYPGVRITALAYLERTRIPVTIDIGFGDGIIPSRTTIDFPVLLDDVKPCVYAYTIESVIAEKLEAIVALGFLNSRYKDFYDICTLSRTFSFDGGRLMAAVGETFAKRNTPMDQIAAFDMTFISDTTHQKRWNAFINKEGAKSEMTLGDAVNEIQRFIMPVVEALREGSILNKTWDYQVAMWK